MSTLDSKTQNSRSAEVPRSHALPSDHVHARELRWLSDLQRRLDAVEAWRGVSAPRQTLAHLDKASNSQLN